MEPNDCITHEWVSDDTTRQDLPDLKWRKLNYRSPHDRTLGQVILAFYRNVSLCSVNKCRVVGLGYKKDHIIQTEIKHHKECYAGWRERLHDRTKTYKKKRRV